MAFSDSDYNRDSEYNRNNRKNGRGSRGPAADDDAGYVRGRGYDGYDEEYWEDEEDYEEFARSMDREYGFEDSRTRGTGRKETKRASDARGRKAAPGRGTGRSDRTDPSDGRSRNLKRVPAAADGYMEAGDLDADSGTVRKKRTSAPSGKNKSRGDVVSGTNADMQAPKKKRRKKRGFLGILLRLIVILFLVVVIAAGVIAFRMKDVLEMQRVNSVDLEEELRQNMNNRAKNDEMMKGYKNIALFGVDSRSGDLLDGDNRSDTIMIASINEKTGEIRLVSVFRDTVLDVGDGYYTKANAAYAIGGPAQAITMLNRNMDLNILDFVTVGFEGLAHTIDALGGIEIEIDEEEREYLNQYVHDMHIELGTDETPVEQSGLVTLTGIQATAYSRIRYTAGDDFRRAERQRTVLKLTLEKAKGASPTTLVDVANNVVGDMATSLSSREIVSLIFMAQKLELKDTGGFPQEDARSFTDVDAGSAVMPDDLRANVAWLHKFLFDDDTYKMSEEVEERNNWMSENLQPYTY